MKHNIGMAAIAACIAVAGCNAAGDADEAAEGEAANNREDLSIVARVDGVRLSDDSHTITFGMPKEDAVITMTEIAGEPTDSGSNNECGAGPMEFTHFHQLTLNFQQEALVGWSLVRGDDALERSVATPGGIAIGSSRAAVDAAPQAVFEETSIGMEFTADGVDGLMSEDAPDGVVTDLWAGTNCIFR